jgi:hypothetical protein
MLSNAGAVACIDAAKFCPPPLPVTAKDAAPVAIPSGT